jgi:hypothetical protein
MYPFDRVYDTNAPFLSKRRGPLSLGAQPREADQKQEKNLRRQGSDICAYGRKLQSCSIDQIWLISQSMGLT